MNKILHDYNWKWFILFATTFPVQLPFAWSFSRSGEGYIKKKQAMTNIATTSTIKVQLGGLIGFARSTVKVQLKGQKEFKTPELHNYIYFPSKLRRITCHSWNLCKLSGFNFLTANTISFPLLDCPLSLSQPLKTCPNSPPPSTVSCLKFLVASCNL